MYECVKYDSPEYEYEYCSGGAGLLLGLLQGYSTGAGRGEVVQCLYSTVMLS